MAEESAAAQRRRRAQGEKADQLRKALEVLDPQLSAWTDDFVFGQVWGRDGLDQDERMLVAITALAALEHPEQLKNYLHGALQAGIPAQKVHETLVMLVVYAGFPVALQALTLWGDVVGSARRRGMVIEVPDGT